MPKYVVETDTGCLIVLSREFVVTYAVQRHDKRGRKRMSGSVTGDPDLIRQAYRATSLRLRLADGSEHALNIVAHSTGSSTAFFKSVEQADFRRLFWRSSDTRGDA
jgi:hypothetical protein